MSSVKAFAGHGKDGDRLAQRVFAAADGTGGFQTVHHRHLHVHPDHVVIAGLYR